MYNLLLKGLGILNLVGAILYLTGISQPSALASVMLSITAGVLFITTALLTKS